MDLSAGHESRWRGACRSAPLDRDPTRGCTQWLHRARAGVVLPRSSDRNADRALSWNRGAHAFASLMPQRIDRVQERRLGGGDEAEDHAGARRDAEAESDGPPGDDHVDNPREEAGEGAAGVAQEDAK